MSATVLIIDDEENARQNITTFLNARGYEVTGAATLKEARTFIQQDRADIIALLKLHRLTMNMERVRAYARALGMEPLFDELDRQA